MSDRIAVVVPTLNEADLLPRLLFSLVTQTTPFDETIVCDGGSVDKTVAIAEAKGATVVHSDRGRGAQIAAGIEKATSEIILVLHADSQCHPITATEIRRHFVENPDSLSGCLGHRFDGTGFLLLFVAWGDGRRARRGISYGDQGQFFRRDILPRIGGFPAIPIMEDLELSRRLRSIGSPAYLNVPILSSNRGFQKLGVFRTVLRNWRLRRAYYTHGLKAAADLEAAYYP